MIFSSGDGKTIQHCQETNLHTNSINEEIMYVDTEEKQGKTGNDLMDMNTRKKPDSTSVIYPTAIKVVQCRMLADNMREK